MKLLLIDQDLRVMPLLVEELRLNGHEAEQATDRRSLRKRMRTGRYDGIILDLMMPGLEDVPLSASECGYIAGAFLYESDVAPTAPQTPFVILTAIDPSTATFDHAVTMLKTYEGYRGWFEKPVRSERLVEALSTE